MQISNLFRFQEFLMYLISIEFEKNRTFLKQFISFYSISLQLQFKFNLLSAYITASFTLKNGLLFNNNIFIIDYFKYLLIFVILINILFQFYLWGLLTLSFKLYNVHFK